MPRVDTNRLLDQLDDAKHHFRREEHKQIEQLLDHLIRRTFKDSDSLIRFHEILLFLRAYPQSSRIIRMVESELSSFSQRVELLETEGADVSSLSHPDVSGIAGTSVIDTFSYNIVRWLLQRHLTQVKFDWSWFEDENRLAETWPRFMPLLEEDALVEANVPYVEWLRAAKDRGGTDLAWLIERFESLPRTDKEKAELYDSLKLYVCWTPSYRATRTGMRLPIRKLFYHRQPLIQRRDISFRDEIQSSPSPLKSLSAKQGEGILNMAREASTVRYRELYGFTHGDPKRILKVSLGRGVDLFVTGVPPSRRLPLRAYHAALIFKNGVPVGYFEGLSLFERMETGFNFYYTFREGETAWIYARTLNVFRHLLGVTAFSLDPYQIGHGNEEGIESGAFWFYRKLGFRPTRPQLIELALAEERKIAVRTSYLTPKRVLRRLAEGPMIFELDDSKSGDWDRFQIRNVGLKVQRRMESEFNGEAERIRAESWKALSGALDIRLAGWREMEFSVIKDFAVALAMIPDLHRWTETERQALAQIVRAKMGPDEVRYLNLLRKHSRLRAELIRLGSRSPGGQQQTIV